MTCRNRLKAVAEGNAKRMYEIDYFVEAVREVKGDMQRRQLEEQGEDGAAVPDAAVEAPDYESAINEAIESIRTKSETDGLKPPVEEHELSIELRTRLGEKIQKKKARTSHGGGYDDDDDLEIVNNHNDDVHALKCPFTAMLFEDPVKDKNCGHTYSRAGLMQMISNRKRNCPVPGCANKNVTLESVEEDEETKLKVRRFKTREENLRRQRELADDEDEEGQGGGYTVIS
jgi:hypothetical protein